MRPEWDCSQQIIRSVEDTAVGFERVTSWRRHLESMSSRNAFWLVHPCRNIESRSSIHSRVEIQSIFFLPQISWRHICCAIQAERRNNTKHQRRCSCSCCRGFENWFWMLLSLEIAVRFPLFPRPSNGNTSFDSLSFSSYPTTTSTASQSAIVHFWFLPYQLPFVACRCFCCRYCFCWTV